MGYNDNILEYKGKYYLFVGLLVVVGKENQTYLIQTQKSNKGDKMRNYIFEFDQQVVLRLGLKLNQLIPVMAQGLLDDIMMKKYDKKSARLTGDLNQYLKSHCIKQVDALKKIGMSKSVLASVNVGYCIRIENAEKICNRLGLKFEDYFDILTTRKPFAKATINSYRKSPCDALSSAKRQRLIAHNYASRDYIETPNGTKKEVIILNEKESIKIAQELEKE